MLGIVSCWCLTLSQLEQLSQDNAGNGWPSLSILWLDRIANLICNFRVGMVGRKIVQAHLSLRLALHVSGTLSSRQTDTLLTSAVMSRARWGWNRPVVPQMVEKRGLDYLRNNCPLVHQDLHNMTRTDAELKYVRECSSPPGAHNLHFYRVRKKKTDKVCNTWLAICARGVEVYEVCICLWRYCTQMFIL